MENKKTTHPVYKDYPEQPYISPNRDLKAWIETPEQFPYGKVEKRQMIRLPEGLLPGDVVMLWRIHFNNFTNESVIPQYFEYRYGVNSDESINTLTNLKYITLGTSKDTLNLLNMTVLKRILKNNNLPVKGKKEELTNRILNNIPEEKLEESFSLRKYNITESGENILKKYDNIIQLHGPKM